MNPSTNIFLLLVALALSGCVTANVGSVTRTFGPDAITIGTSPATTIVNGVIQADLVSDPTFDNGNMEAFRNAGFTKQGYYGDTTSGSGYAMIGVTHIDALSYGSAQYARINDTDLPSSGIVNYAGDYAGVFGGARTNTWENSLSRLVTGDVALTANFNNNSVSGAITNRQLRDSTSNAVDGMVTLADLTLAGTAMANGLYVGSTSGGAVTVGGTTWPYAVGTYEGLITGPSGGETVGVVRVGHGPTAGVQDGMELGAFVAE